MKKIRLLMVIFLSLFLFSGCMSIDIDYEIDKNYNVSLTYHVEADLEQFDEDSANGLLEILDSTVDKYLFNGFVLDGKITDDEVDFTLTLIIETDSYEEAYEVLRDVMTDPDFTFFLTIDMSTQAEEYEQAFNFHAETDLNKIIAASTLNQMPPTIRNRIYEGMDNSSVNFTLTMPSLNVLEHSSDAQVEQKSKTTVISSTLKWEEPTIVSFVARMSLDDGKVVAVTMDESIQNTRDQIALYNALTYVGFGGAVLTVAGAVYFLLQKKKETETKTEE